MTAGLIVALMISPIVTSITREVFLTVPRNDKDGALALGATRWEMIKGVVFPYSTSGISGAVMLGLGLMHGRLTARHLERRALRLRVGRPSGGMWICPP